MQDHLPSTYRCFRAAARSQAWRKRMGAQSRQGPHIVSGRRQHSSRSRHPSSCVGAPGAEATAAHSQGSPGSEHSQLTGCCCCFGGTQYVLGFCWPEWPVVGFLCLSGARRIPRRAKHGAGFPCRALKNGSGTATLPQHQCLL